MPLTTAVWMASRSHHAIAMVLIGLLNACAVAPSRVSLAPAPGPLQAEASLAGEHGAWPERNWFRAFADPQLDALIEEALQHNPGLDIARARLHQAEAALQPSDRVRRMQGGAGAGLTRFKTSETVAAPPEAGRYWYTEADVFASLRWDLDLWGRLREQRVADQARVQAADAELEQSRLVLSCALAHSYNELAGALSELALLEQTRQRREQLLQLITARENLGLDSGLQRQSRLKDLAGIEQRIENVRTRVARIKIRLAALLGRGPDRTLTIAAPALASVRAPLLPDDLPLHLLARRPDVIAAKWRVEEMGGRVKVAHTRFYPDINLNAVIGLSSFGLERLLRPQSLRGEVRPAISLPWFNTAALNQLLDEDSARYEEAVADYRQTVVGALGQVAESMENLRAASEQLRSQQQVVDAASRSYELTRLACRRGLRSCEQEVERSIDLLDAELMQQQWRYQQRDWHIGLVRALGGGYDGKAVR